MKRKHTKKTRLAKRRGSAAQVTHCDALPEGVLLYTRRQMAAALQVSVRYLDRLRSEGSIREIRMNDRIIRFHPEEVLRYLDEKAAGSSDQSPIIGDQKGMTEPPHVGCYGVQKNNHNQHQP